MTHRIAPRVLLLALLAAAPLGAQSWKDKLKDKAKTKTTERVDQHTDAAIDRALDSGDSAAAQAVSGKKTTPHASTPGTPPPGAGAAGGAGGAGAAGASGQASGVATARVAASFDFIPGDDPIFVEDFSTTPVNQFPERLDLVEGNMQVVIEDGRHWLAAPEGGHVTIDLPDTLPSRFSIEVALYTPQDNNPLYISTADVSDFGSFSCFHATGKVEGGTGFPSAEQRLEDKPEDAVTTCRLLVDGRAARAYLDETRVANLPKSAFKRSRKLYLELPNAGAANPTRITDLRVMGGGRDLYDAITRDGHVAARGIYFAEGSNVVSPESGPTLDAIARMLAAHPDLRLIIQGHTDNVGDPSANLRLSSRRAIAVRDALFARGVSRTGSVLGIQGYGDTVPVATNDTPEGRARNRRVELVKVP